MKYKQRAFSRQKRKEQIIVQFNIWHSKGDTEPKTMTRIARALDLTPQQHVKSILDEMVLEGMLTVEKRDKSGRWTANVYSIINALIKEKYGRRRINVKHRGVVSGQLEMAL